MERLKPHEIQEWLEKLKPNVSEEKFKALKAIADKVLVQAPEDEDALRFRG